MKTIYSLIFILCFATLASAQRVVSANPFVIPSSGTVTITIRCHNAFLLSHNAYSARLFQTTNSNGSTYNSTSRTLIDNNNMTATFTISNPAHGGYYNLAVFESGYIINYLENAVYMSGVEERRLMAVNPNFGFAGTTLTAQITGTGAHFMTSTGFPQVGYIQLQNEIDYSSVMGSNISYIDSNHVNVDFTLPPSAVNGSYKMTVDLQQQQQTNRPRFFYVVGGLNRRIVSVTPHEGGINSTVFLHVRVVGRNLITSPVYSASLVPEEALGYSVYTSGTGITTVDSNNLILRFTINGYASIGDYSLQLNGNFIKHYAFRIVPPNITGQVFYDSNSNGIKDNIEAGISGKHVLLLPDSIIAITNNDGRYFYYADSGNYTLQYIPDSTFTLTSSPSSYNIFVDDSIISGLDFGVHHYSCCPDYHHELIVVEHPLRCDVTGYNWMSIHNPTESYQTGTLTHVHSPNLTVTYTAIVPSYTNGDTLQWNYSLNPGQTLVFDVHYHDPPAGSAVWYTNTDVSYDSVGAVAFQYNERFDFVVTCSCDPNEKSVSPAQDSLHPTTLATADLDYTIRFQNTGNDTAFLVTIVDTLNPFLDLNTFELLGASHLVYTNISYPEHVVTFTFDNILLPDSTTDYPGSNGFVKYKIRALLGIPDSTLVTNASFIYFDFNPYVPTDTTSSLMTYIHNPVASFNSPTSVCGNGCINFANTSTYSTSWDWSFPGASPSSSVDENPQGICYSTPGIYDVILIATSGVGSDTITMTNYLHVNPLPVSPVVTILNDTMYCGFDTSYVSYQWYDSLGIIVGATNSYYVPLLSGTYGVMVTNLLGCETLTAVSLILDLKEPPKNNFEIYPNPANNRLYVISNNLSSTVIIELYNMVGEKIMEREMRVDERKITLDISDIPQGIYFIRYTSSDGIINRRFVKN